MTSMSTTAKRRDNGNGGGKDPNSSSLHQFALGITLRLQLVPPLHLQQRQMSTAAVEDQITSEILKKESQKLTVRLSLNSCIINVESL